MTVLSAAIKAVPDDIIEAARIDGASGLRLFWSVTIPSIRPTLVVVGSTVAITSLKAFDIVNVMGGNLPGEQRDSQRVPTSPGELPVRPGRRPSRY